MDNLFDALPDASGAEVFETILEQGIVKLERIVSHGQVTPSGEWLSSPHREWVLLVEGEARLRLSSEEHERILRPGDHLIVPAQCRHRVEFTATDRPTIWLALYY